MLTLYTNNWFNLDNFSWENPIKEMKGCQLIYAHLYYNKKLLASSAFCSILRRSSLVLFNSHISHALREGEAAGCTDELNICFKGVFGSSDL